MSHRKTIILFTLLTVQSIVQAQKPNPVHFNYTVAKNNDKSYDIHMTATLDAGWHIYSQEQPTEAIAIPTKIVFTKNPVLQIDGKAKEMGEKEKYEDKNAGIVQYQYAKVDFVQSIKLKATAKTNLSGTITYQACTDEMCLPPKTVSFTIAIE